MRSIVDESISGSLMLDDWEASTTPGTHSKFSPLTVARAALRIAIAHRVELRRRIVHAAV